MPAFEHKKEALTVRNTNAKFDQPNLKEQAHSFRDIFSKEDDESNIIPLSIILRG